MATTLENAAQHFCQVGILRDEGPHIKGRGQEPGAAMAKSSLLFRQLPNTERSRQQRGEKRFSKTGSGSDLQVSFGLYGPDIKNFEMSHFQDSDSFHNTRKPFRAWRNLYLMVGSQPPSSCILSFLLRLLALNHNGRSQTSGDSKIKCQHFFKRLQRLPLAEP